MSKLSAMLREFGKRLWITTGDRGSAMNGNEVMFGEKVRCYESKGNSLDAFTVVYMGRRQTGFQHSNVFESVGLDGHCGAKLGRHLGKRVLFASLPASLRKIVEEDLKPAPHRFNPDHNLYCVDCGEGEIDGNHGILARVYDAELGGYVPVYADGAVKLYEPELAETWGIE